MSGLWKAKGEAELPVILRGALFGGPRSQLLTKQVFQRGRQLCCPARHWQGPHPSAVLFSSPDRVGPSRCPVVPDPLLVRKPPQPRPSGEWLMCVLIRPAFTFLHDSLFPKLQVFTSWLWVRKGLRFRQGEIGGPWRGSERVNRRWGNRSDHLTWVLGSCSVITEHDQTSKKSVMSGVVNCPCSDRDSTGIPGPQAPWWSFQ